MLNKSCIGTSKEVFNIVRQANREGHKVVRTDQTVIISDLDGEYYKALMVKAGRWLVRYDNEKLK